MTNIKNASFGGRKNPRQLLEEALALNNLSGVALVTFTDCGEVEVDSAGLDSAKVVFAGQALITAEMVGG